MKEESKLTQSDILFLWFLFGFAIIFSLVPSFWFHTILIDSAQNLSWGHVLAWSYNRHPPLGVWFISLLSIFLNNQAAAYTASVICLSVSLLFVYKLSKRYLEPKVALIATLSSTLSLYYLPNMVFEYNQNLILEPFWVLCCYFFERCLRYNFRIDWALLGLCFAASFLAKYESLIILFALLAYFIWQFDRKYLINFFIAVMLATLLLLPHMISVMHFGFLSIKFIFLRIQSDIPHSFAYKHLAYPLIALFEQLSHILPGLIFVTFLYRFKIFSSSKENRIISCNYLIYLGFSPLIIVIILSMLMGFKLVTEWGYPLFAFTIPALLTFRAIRLKSSHLSPLLLVILGVHLTIFGIFELANYYSTRGVRSSHPSYPSYALVAKAQEYWSNYTDKPLKIIGGEEPIDYFLTAYLPSKPLLFEEFSFEKSPWLSKAQLQNEGALIVLNDCIQSKNNKIKNKLHARNIHCIQIPIDKKKYSISANYSFMIIPPANVETFHK